MTHYTDKQIRRAILAACNRGDYPSPPGCRMPNISTRQFYRVRYRMEASGEIVVPVWTDPRWNRRSTAALPPEDHEKRIAAETERVQREQRELREEIYD